VKASLGAGRDSLPAFSEPPKAVRRRNRRFVDKKERVKRIAAMSPTQLEPGGEDAAFRPICEDRFRLRWLEAIEVRPIGPAGHAPSAGVRRGHAC
jgi:hypothetical protein